MSTGVSGRIPTVLAGKTVAPWVRRLGWPILLVAGVIAVFCCALIQAGQMGVQSDGASMVLESWAMSHGNPLLHGWYLADVTFYTTELPEYIIIEAFRGMHTDVVTIAAALTYTLLVVLAAALAYGGGSSRRAGVCGAVVAVAVMLCPVPAAVTVLLNDPDHVGSAVPVLFALLIAGRLLSGPATGWRLAVLPVAVAVVLGVATVGDPLIVLIGIVPLVAVCGGRVLWQCAARRRPFAGVSAEITLAVAGLVAAAAGVELPTLIPRAGGYTMLPLAQHAMPLAMQPRNVAGIGENFLELFSVWFNHAKANAWLAVTGVHLVFACLVAAALILSVLRLHRVDLISRMLVVGIIANMAGYSLLYTVTPVNVREIGPVFGLGAALAGRVLAEPAARWRLERLVAVAAVAALAVGVPTLLAVKPTGPMAANLADFLAGHQLRHGLAGYWQSNNITVETGGRVTVIPLRQQPGAGLAPYKWELDSAQLRNHGQLVNFVVTTSPGKYGPNTVTEAEAVALFGQPDRVYRLDPGYTILVWRKNLLAALPGS
jgi:hypothetical protein